MEGIEKIENTLDKVLLAVLDNQSRISNLSDRLDQVESTVERTYDKIDGFLALISRHEAEIAAVRSKLERLEDRVGVLESR